MSLSLQQENEKPPHYQDWHSQGYILRAILGGPDKSTPHALGAGASSVIAWYIGLPLGRLPLWRVFLMSVTCRHYKAWLWITTPPLSPWPLPKCSRLISSAGGNLSIHGYMNGMSIFHLDFTWGSPLSCETVEGRGTFHHNHCCFHRTF